MPTPPKAGMAALLRASLSDRAWTGGSRLRSVLRAPPGSGANTHFKNSSVLSCCHGDSSSWRSVCISRMQYCLYTPPSSKDQGHTTMEVAEFGGGREEGVATSCHRKANYFKLDFKHSFFQTGFCHPMRAPPLSRFQHGLSLPLPDPLPLVSCSPPLPPSS